MADLTVVGNGKKNGKAEGKIVSITQAREQKSEGVTLKTPPSEHAEVRAKVLELRKRADESYWELSIGLHSVYTNSYYLAWGYEKWEHYVEAELQFKSRKAQYLVGIQEWFGKMDPRVQSWIRELGWTKAKELTGVVTNENAGEWKRKIAGKSYKEMMDVIRGGGADADGGKALPGEGDKGPEKSQKLTVGLFPEQYQNVEAALQKAMEIAGSDKKGHALDCICTDFIAGNAGTDSQSEYLAKVERSLPGIRLVAIDVNEKAIVYGEENIDALDGEEEETE